MSGRAGNHWRECLCRTLGVQTQRMMLPRRLRPALTRLVENPYIPGASRAGFATRRVPGQSLVLVALLMPVLIALVLTFLEIGTRLLQRAEAEDALRHASRSAIQTFAYEPFAAGTAEVREADMLAIAKSTFAINLGGVHGLLTAPQETAGSVGWQPILTGSGSCGTSGAPAVEVAAPALCAEVELRMRGLTGWGEWRTRVFVVETLDQVR